MTGPPTQSAPPAWVLHRDGPDVRIWGLTPGERLRRSLVRAGCGEVETVSGSAPPRATGADAAVVIRGDLIIDERVVDALVGAPDTVVVAEHVGAVGAHVPSARLAETVAALRAGDAPPGLRCVAPGEIADPYIPHLRKSEPPYVYPARADRVREVEERTFAASYKGITDLVTKWVWPRPAAFVTGICARAGVRPNTVTLWSWIAALAAMGLFAGGHFLSGLAVAWLMTFLDTVDGKLARVTLTSSRLGDVLDHGLDLIHPPFWYLAWVAGLGWGRPFETVAVVGGYVAGRLLEGAFLAAFKIETHSWRPLDSLFRTVTARRNPNLILLSVGTLGGRPDLGFSMVALWTLASLGFHCVRLLQAARAHRRGEPIAPWDEPGAAEPTA